MEPQALSLDCEALAEFRLTLDVLLRHIVEKMVEKGMDSGDITGRSRSRLRTRKSINRMEGQNKMWVQV